ncbi:MAG TPA: N-acetyltransferase [Chthonomonadaceae bacterium]|nr:N-acetyltransferase [Chthonomonadaceae bacterium]
MDTHIRSEVENDRQAIREVNDLAFGRPVEGGIVEKVRQSEGFIPELSLVAEREGRIVGHALFSEVTIEGEARTWTVLALGPIAVRPEFQKQGIGGRMLRAGLERAAELGHGVVVLIGHPTYYPRFGFVPAGTLGLKCAIPVPANVFMAYLLRPDGLDGIQGTVVFPPAFQE